MGAGESRQQQSGASSSSAMLHGTPSRNPSSRAPRGREQRYSLNVDPSSSQSYGSDSDDDAEAILHQLALLGLRPPRRIRSTGGHGHGHLRSLPDVQCPICSERQCIDVIEAHIVMCLAKPRLQYNEDVLTEDTGECVICFDELEKDNVIARLPCLCIYHKSCIDSWFKVNRTCPAHPGNDNEASSSS